MSWLNRCFEHWFEYLYILKTFWRHLYLIKKGAFLSRSKFSVSLVLVAALMFAMGCMSEWKGGVNVAFKQDDTKTLIALVPEYSKVTGLEPGDILLAVDGEDVTNMAFKNIRALLQGPVGSFTVLTIRRDMQVITLEVERRKLRSL